MSLDGAEIRVFHAGDEKEIIDGLSSSLGRGVSLEDWSWSYPTLDGGRPVVVAVAGGSVVAHVGGVISEFQLNGRTVRALAVTDEYALPTVGGADERRRLLADLLETLVTEFGGGDRPHLIYRLAGEGEASGDSGANGGARVELPPVDVLSRRKAVRSRLRRLAFRAEPARDWEPRLDDLWRRVRPSYPFAAVRDAETALHRHAGHPTVRRHRFLVFPRFSSRAVAFAVFETNASCCRWVDLLWDHGEPGALDLVCHLSRRLASQVGAMDERIVLGGDGAARAHLERQGFRPEGVLEDLSFRVFSLPPDTRAGDLASRCYVTQTDLDPLRRIG